MPLKIELKSKHKLLYIFFFYSILADLIGVTRACQKIVRNAKKTLKIAIKKGEIKKKNHCTNFRINFVEKRTKSTILF